MSTCSTRAGFALATSACLCLVSQTLLAAEPEAASSPVPSVVDDAPTHVQLSGTVTIVGARPSSLPTVIPTTLESLTGRELQRQVNATDASDALKYFPSLLVRKRYVGDYDHAVLSTRASGTGNSARSLVYADGILLSNLLGNGASFTPRWGLVTPEEIDRVDVLYGPFSAAYAGNSAGAVVDYRTRMPERFEAHGNLKAFSNRFRYGGSDGRFGGGSASTSVGNRAALGDGSLAWWLHLSRQDSESQPLVFTTRTPSATAAPAGTRPVSGALAQLNRFNQAWLLLGDSSRADTGQDHAKIKLAWQQGPWQAHWTFGAWLNQVQRSSQSWLRDENGAVVDITPANYSGFSNGQRAVAMDGRLYTLTAADFGRTREKLNHQMHGLRLRHQASGPWVWSLGFSQYRYAEDDVQAWSPAANAAAAGRLTRMAGTGWQTLAFTGSWRPASQVSGTAIPAGSSTAASFEWGLQQDTHRLRTGVFTLADWTQVSSASFGTPLSRFEGRTQLTSLWAQRLWIPDVHPAGLQDLRVVLGLRAERWRADQGLTSSGSSRFNHPVREEQAFSPKLAASVALSDAWVLKASTGRALRFPTVSELFQGGVQASTGNLLNGDPTLKPERSWTQELSAERHGVQSQLRATLFTERTRDALYSQTNTTVTPNVTNVQNIELISTRGLELAGQWSDVGAVSGRQGLQLGASLTFTASTIEANSRFPASEGRWQPRVPRWRAHAVASWPMTPTLTGTAGLRLARQQFNTLDNSDPNGAVYQGVSDMLVSDLRLLWKPSARWSLALGVDNLGNAT